MLLILRQYIVRFLVELAHGYAFVSLVPSRKAGFLLALCTFLEPGMGAHGLIGAICAWLAGQLAGADATERPICVFNGLLVGLFVGHVWIAGFGTIGITVMGGIFSGWLAVVLGRLTWSLLQLPILSLPFVWVAMITGAAGGSLSSLQYNPYIAPPEMFGTQVDKFLSAFGNFYFSPNPFIGALVLAVICVASRYFLFMALLGYAAALFWLKAMGAAPEHLASTAWDSNAILAALLVGGLFARPSMITAISGMLAAVMACWISLGLGRILDTAHLVPFSTPFVLASWLVLYAVVRNVRVANHFNLLVPDFPERSHERAQISQDRVGNPTSVPLALPCMGVWTIMQGFFGKHTHRGPWRYALDFIVMKNSKSFANRGNRLADFYCYNLPVLSPAYGQVWRIVNDIPDNAPGTVNVVANWGNCVVIRLHNGKFVVIAHLVPGSVSVCLGTWVKPGDFIGRCGNSGRSPQPHIHLHVQANDDLVAPTLPFHMANVLMSSDGEPAHYELAAVPQESATIYAAAEGDTRPFYLLAGRGLRYTVADNANISADWSIRCEVDTLGRLVLVSSAGGRCVAESTWAIFSCYERHGHADPYFDLWLLACGYTPISHQVDCWHENATPARLLPQSLAKWIAVLAWPWATFAKSDYQRQWDEETQAFRQEAWHRQKITGISTKTTALIVPQYGCTYITAEVGQSRYTMQVSSSFQVADIGVPSWEVPIGGFLSFRRLV